MARWRIRASGSSLLTGDDLSDNSDGLMASVGQLLVVSLDNLEAYHCTGSAI